MAQSPSAPPSTTSPASPDDPSVARPFGPGQPIELQCDEPDAYVYVAKGIVDERVAFPDPFTKVGKLPLELELPKGVYTLLVEGESQTSASTVFEVRHEPVHVRVNAGSGELRALSTLLLALGSAALLAGGVLEISGTGEGDDDKKHKITIPLFIGGGVGVAGGLTAYFVSDSSIEHDGYVPPSMASTVPGLVVSGKF